MIVNVARFALAVVGTLGASATPVSEKGSTSRELAVSAFIEEMSAKHGFDRAELERAFASIRPRPKIVELMDRAATPKPWEDYRALFVNGEKLSGGERFWHDNESALALARERYGVPEEVITAVIGVETHYGKHTGGFKVLESLATLAFDYPRRAKLFRLELEHFLLLAREEKLPLATPLGSYAGAMGIAQFMPGSYRRYAVDFDADGKRDLFEDAADAIGSVANYLTAHGWQRGQPVAVPAAVSDRGGEAFRTSKLSTRYPLGELEALGVEASGAFEARERVIPITLERSDGPEHWLGFENFYVITRYNHSAYYAMAVYQLAEELRDQRERSLAAKAGAAGPAGGAR